MVRGVFISAYAAVAVTGAAAVTRGMMGQVEDWEIRTAPFCLALVFFSSRRVRAMCKSPHGHSVRHGAAATANRRSRRAEVGRVIAGALGSERFRLGTTHSTHR